jgi:hypothetical protein
MRDDLEGLFGSSRNDEQRQLYHGEDVKERAATVPLVG